jgi:O-antigen/teichoic acid export membrane protein
VLKVALVVGGLGVTGALISDAVASTFLALLLLSELRTRATLAFDWAPLREALRFSIPKVPHGLLAQTLNLADRRILEEFVSLGQVGIYSVGNNFAGAMKFPLSAFEPAWQPFVFENAKKPGGAGEIALVATRMAILFVTIALALALILPDLLIFMAKKPEFHAAAPVVPVVILGILFQGFFFLSSVGITVTKEARYYPIITGVAAVVNIALNLWLIPYYGIMASAWATVAGYALTAFIGASISENLYPIPIEWPRIAVALASALLAFATTTYFGYGLGPAIVRVTVALIFALCVWTLVCNETDRREFRKVVGF